MGYIPDVQFAPFYVAAEKGYFRDEGIEIEFESMFENDSAPLLGSNERQFATISAEQVLQARAQGLPLVYVAAWYQKFPVAVVARQSLGLAAPADLKGHTLGLPGLYGASYIGARALLKVAGLAESEVTFKEIGFNQVAAFTAGQADIVVVYANNEPVQLQASGAALTIFNVADYVPMASNGMVTNETTIAAQPELVRGMVRALLRGLADTIADPDAAFTISTKYVEGLGNADAAKTAAQKQVLAASIELWRAERLGRSDPMGWEQTQAVLLDMGLLSAPLDLNQAYTNEFVP
jgi:NitT/TauT family transport system substrate-binding protein